MGTLSTCWALLLWACLTGAAAQPPWVGVSSEPGGAPSILPALPAPVPQAPLLWLTHRRLVLDSEARAGSWSHLTSGTSRDHIPQSPTFPVAGAHRHRGSPARPRQEVAFRVAWGRAGPQGCGSPSCLGFFTKTTAFWVPVHGPTPTPAPRRRSCEKKCD